MKPKMQCPYFVMVILTSILFVVGYMLFESGFFEKSILNTDSKEVVSGNDLSGNAVSENDIAENAVPETETVIAEAETETVEEETTVEEQSEPEQPVLMTDEEAEWYLTGSAFIGDSRTEALKLYAGWDTAHFYSKTGLNIWDVLDEKVVTKDGKTLTVQEAVQQTKFNRIYIMLGVNELGTGTTESFVEQYGEVVDVIKESQPHAKIIVQAIMHVTKNKSAQGTAVNNRIIDERNAALKEMAEEKGVEWLDANEVLDDADGCLDSRYTSDGVHLKVKYLDIWKQFILEHPFW